MKVWVMTGTSESGDDYIWVFKNEPSKDLQWETVEGDIHDEVFFVDWILKECEVLG